jgi:hypothetical protein
VGATIQGIREPPRSTDTLLTDVKKAIDTIPQPGTVAFGRPTPAGEGDDDAISTECPCSPLTVYMVAM